MGILHWSGLGVRVWIYKLVQDDKGWKEGGEFGEMGV
jgi:hypothetical protein